MNMASREYQEKRDFMRMRVDSPATLSLEDGSVIEVNCADLSSSGLKIHSTTPLPIDTKAELTMASGSGITNDLKARIVIQRIDCLGDDDFCMGATIDSYL